MRRPARGHRADAPTAGGEVERERRPSESRAHRHVGPSQVLPSRAHRWRRRAHRPRAPGRGLPRARRWMPGLDGVVAEPIWSQRDEFARQAIAHVARAAPRPAPPRGPPAPAPEARPGHGEIGPARLRSDAEGELASRRARAALRRSFHSAVRSQHNPSTRERDTAATHPSRTRSRSRTSSHVSRARRRGTRARRRLRPRCPCAASASRTSTWRPRRPPRACSRADARPRSASRRHGDGPDPGRACRRHQLPRRRESERRPRVQGLHAERARVAARAGR